MLIHSAVFHVPSLYFSVISRVINVNTEVSNTFPGSDTRALKYLFVIAMYLIERVIKFPTSIWKPTHPTFD